MVDGYNLEKQIYNFWFTYKDTKIRDLGTQLDD